MNDSEALEALRKDLGSPFYQTRLNAVKRAYVLLRQASVRDQVRSMLEGRARDDPDTEVKMRATDVLNAIDSEHAGFLPDDSKHMVMKQCPGGHENWIDRRRVCANSTRVVRSTGPNAHIINIQCGKCQIEFEAEVNCEGYIYD